MIYRKIEPDEYDQRMLRMIDDFCRETDADDQAFLAIMNRMGEGRTTVFAAENGKLCGLLGYCISGDTAIPDFFYVRPEYRKRMVGGRLMKTASSYAKQYQSVKKIVPMVTQDKEALYTKIGFRRSKFILLEKEI